MNLRPDREAFYRAKPRAASAILEDITRHLTKRFKRPIDIALALEPDGATREIVPPSRLADLLALLCKNMG